MSLIEFKTDLTRSQLRQFAWLWFPLAGSFLGFLLWKRLQLPVAAIGLWSVIGLTALIAFVQPKAVRPVFIALMCAAFPIGWVVSHLVLSVVYFVAITPIGFLLRTMYKDPMQRKLDPEAETYWEPHQQVKDPARYFRQF